MPIRKYDKRFAIMEGNWGAQIGPDMMWQQLEDGHGGNEDQIALICMHQSSRYLEGFVGESTFTEGCLTWTYRQLMVGTKNLAERLVACGVKRGDTLVAYLPNSADWALSYWVSAYLELTFVPLDPATLDPYGTEHGYPLELLKPSIILVPTLKDAYDFDQLYSDVQESIAVKVVCHEQSEFMWHSWVALESLEKIDDLEEGDDGNEYTRPGANDRRIPDNRVAVVLFTENSPDNPPKGCPLTVLNLRTALINQSFIPPKRYLVADTASSSATLEAMMLAWSRGGTVVVQGSFFSPEWTLDAIELHACTRLFCTASQLDMLIKHPSIPQRQFKSLERLSVSGGVVDERLLAEGQRVFQVDWASSSLSLCEGLGILGWHDVDPADRTLSSVGKVMLGSSVKICNEIDIVLNKEEEGRLHISGDAMIDGYLEGNAGRRFYQNRQGTIWFVTDYVATMDRNGLICLTRRLVVSL